ncbi:MAG: ribonuclease R [Methylotenera sp.]|nr:ribonuclease R [Oligoflexia bacterium]
MSPRRNRPKPSKSSKPSRPAPGSVGRFKSQESDRTEISSNPDKFEGARPEKKFKGRGPQSGPAQSAQPFTFKDRSGKVHNFAKGRGPQAAQTPDSDEFRSYPSSKAPKNPAAAGAGTGPSKIIKNAPSEDFTAPKGGPRGPKKDFKGGRPSSPGGTGGNGPEGRRGERPGSSGRGGRPGGTGKPDHKGRNDRGRSAEFEARKARDEEGNKSRTSSGFQKLKARVDKNRKGFAFLSFETKGVEDAFVNPRDASNLFHGDRVEVSVSPRGEITHISVIEHRFREIVGRFMPHPAGKGKGGLIVYERKKAREEIFVAHVPPKIVEGDWVRAKLEFHEAGRYLVTGEITKHYGPELPPSADIEMVAAEFNLIEEHSAAAVREASQFRLGDRELKDRNRKDLRDVPFITIDGETARDFDDAIYVEKTKTGFVLWVAIADVSHYVTDGSALDKEAKSRATSVYFPERAFHMLPRALSENLCSLRPNEPRLAMVAKMEMDLTGKRTKIQVMEALIESRRRATYTEIQKEWETNQGNTDWEYAPHFQLYRLLRKLRNDRGSIDFDLPESEVVVEPTGEPVSITRRDRVDAHRLIEEFMIAANEAVTSWTMEQGWPFIYRVHDEPAERSLLKFQELVSHAGINFNVESQNLSQALNELVKKLEGHPAQTLLNTALLRSMKQAVYSAEHGIHFGLASEGYTHFTSPIRRYPDLVVHRILRMILQNRVSETPGALKKADKDKLQAELEETAEHCSYRERIASDAERESIKLKQVRIMIPHVGSDFEGKVVGMTENGLFVQIPDPYVEGMVSKDTMNDDSYEFQEERMIFVGRRKKRTFKIGTPVMIKVIKASIDLRQIDFALVDTPKSKKTSDDLSTNTRQFKK